MVMVVMIVAVVAVWPMHVFGLAVLHENGVSLVDQIF